MRNASNQPITLRLLKALMYKVPIYIYAKDNNHRITYANRRLLEMCGLSEQELLGKTSAVVKTLSGKSYLKRSRCYDEKVLKTGTSLYNILEWFKSAEGKCHFRSWKLSLVNGRETSGLLSVSLDVTGEITKEDHLEDQQTLLQTVMDIVHHPLWFKDVSGKYGYHNKAFESFLGQTELIGKTPYDVLPQYLAHFHDEQDTEIINKAVAVSYKAPGYPLRSEYTVINKKVPFLRANGKIGGVVGMIIEAPDERRRNDSLADIFFKHADQGVLVLDECRIIDCSDVAQQMLDRTRDELVSMDIGSLVPDYQPDGSSSEDAICQTLENTADPGYRRHEIIFRKGDQSLLHARVCALPFQDGGKTLMCALLEDISDRRRMESVLQQSRSLIDTMIESSKDGVALVRRDGDVVKTNGALDALFSEGEIYLLPNDEIAKSLRSLISLLPVPSRAVELRGITRSRERKYVEVSVREVNYGGNETLLVTSRDLTREALSDERVIFDWTQNRKLAGYLSEPIFEIHSDGTVRYFNRAARNLFGYSMQFFADGTRNILSFIAPEDRSRFCKSLSSLACGERNGAISYTGLKADGTRFKVTVLSVPVNIKADGHMHFRGIIRGAAHADAEIPRSGDSTYEYLYKAVFENSGGAIVIIEQTLSVTSANAYFHRLTGHCRDGMQASLNIADFLDHRSVKRIERFTKKLPCTDQPDLFEATVLERGGERRRVFVTINVIPETMQYVLSLIESAVQHPLPLCADMKPVVRPDDEFPSDKVRFAG